MSAAPSEQGSRAVLGSLLVYPGEDTAAAVAQRSGLPVAEVEATLAELQRRHALRRWETHWQLTTTGSAEATRDKAELERLGETDGTTWGA
jgi:DNA-binding IclR family transcriptional regulator